MVLLSLAFIFLIHGMESVDQNLVVDLSFSLLNLTTPPYADHLREVRALVQLLQTKSSRNSNPHRMTYKKVDVATELVGLSLTPMSYQLPSIYKIGRQISKIECSTGCEDCKIDDRQWSDFLIPELVLVNLGFRSNFNI